MKFTREKAAQLGFSMGVETAAILAVTEVESGGRADLPDGRPQILFERHIFSRLTSHRFDSSHPNISWPIWNRDAYVGGVGEYERLEQAMALDTTAALKSASWGLPQIMGFNHNACGFDTVQEFVAFIKGGDDNDMICFARFIDHHPVMLHALQQKDWPTFTYHYNGPGQVVHYSNKIARAYLHHSRVVDLPPQRPEFPSYTPGTQGQLGKRPLLYRGCPRSTYVTTLQQILGFKGSDVDGFFGPNTEAAVKLFQHRKGTAPDGKVGAITWALLDAELQAAT